MLTPMNPRNYVLDESPGGPWEGTILTKEGLAPTCPTILGRELSKTAEPIEKPFDLWTRVGTRKHVLDEGAYWRHLANTIEPSGAALCYTTLTSCSFLHMHNVLRRGLLLLIE